MAIIDKREKNLEAVKRFREKERREKVEQEERGRKIREKVEENERRRREIERLKKELESTRTLYREMNKHNPSFVYIYNQTIAIIIILHFLYIFSNIRPKVILFGLYNRV